MFFIRILAGVLIIAAVLISGCASPYIKAEREYFKGDPASAEKILTPVSTEEDAKDGRMKNLYLWDLGIYRFSQGNYEGALGCFMRSVKSYEQIHDTGDAVKSVFSNSSSSQYIGDPVEVSIAYLYIGLCYYQIGDYQNALVGFRRSMEEDLSKDETRHGDMGVTNYLLGENYSRMGEYDDAVAAYRRASMHAPELVPAYIGCYNALKKQGDEVNAPNMLAEIGKHVDAETLSAIEQHSGEGITVIIMSGRASEVKADAFLGAFRKRKKIKDDVLSWEIICRTSVGKGSLGLADEMQQHFKDQGGLGDEMKQQATRAVVGSAMKQVPCLGAFAPSTDADVRYWPTMPGYVYVGCYWLKPGMHNIDLNAYDKRHTLITSRSKSWKDVEVTAGRRTLLVASSYGL